MWVLNFKVYVRAYYLVIAYAFLSFLNTFKEIHFWTSQSNKYDNIFDSKTKW